MPHLYAVDRMRSGIKLRAVEVVSAGPRQDGDPGGAVVTHLKGTKLELQFGVDPDDGAPVGANDRVPFFGDLKSFMRLPGDRTHTSSRFLSLRWSQTAAGASGWTGNQFLISNTFPALFAQF